ncbi:hypothetical protein CEY16_09290 [Halalkalibacillus sediminis]|uniref:DUF3055 domain-containing protein n=1 Tax=Halalkalibacillus sediminis TaxID=2018042 RepID=A0A2I0QVH2_9BACI|nr:SAV0927 family protein [Halalkalibacillus sediminis]PKR78100.1 hypothetical protein CEY16_09290 [Halalkalibacillus sediminis]
MDDQKKYLINETKQVDIRYISFMGELRRYDLAIMKNPSNLSEYVIIDLDGSRYTKVRPEQLHDGDFFCHAFNVNEYQAEELYSYIKDFLV